MFAKYFILVFLGTVAGQSQDCIMMTDDIDDPDPVCVDLEEQMVEYNMSLSNPRSFNGGVDVKLNLYTRKNPSSPELIAVAKIPSHFNSAHPTRIVVHGFRSSAKSMDHFRKAYLDTGKEYNIIIVDWSSLADTVHYGRAKASALTVGKYMAGILEYLEFNANLNLSNLYLIGHSLGAHAVGVAGYKLDGKVARIVGLDAAAPLFGSEAPENRLDATDGKFVEGIHTNGALLGWFGPFGHADFYPNGGLFQPMCSLALQAICSHSESHILYAESIISEDLLGTRCYSYEEYTKGKCTSTTAIMGEQTSKRATGKFYLTTYSKGYGKGLLRRVLHFFNIFRFL